MEKTHEQVLMEAGWVKLYETDTRIGKIVGANTSRGSLAVRWVDDEGNEWVTNHKPDRLIPANPTEFR